MRPCSKRASIPSRSPGRVSSGKAHQLYKAVRKVLDRAVRLGGTTFSDYLDIEGRPGAFLEQVAGVPAHRRTLPALRPRHPPHRHRGAQQPLLRPMPAAATLTAKMRGPRKSRG